MKEFETKIYNRKVRLNYINDNIFIFDEKWFVEKDIITNDKVDILIIDDNDFSNILKIKTIKGDINEIKIGDYFYIKDFKNYGKI